MPRTTHRAVTASLLAVLLTLSACTGTKSGPSPEPPKDAPQADYVVGELVKGLQTGDVTKVPIANDAAVADVELKLLMAGMDGFKPKVTPGAISYEGTRATVPLEQKITFGTGPAAATWSWTTTAHLTLGDSAWDVQWDPNIVHPELNGTTRLRHVRVLPRRASIVGANGKALVEVRTAYRVGIDKANLDKAKWASTARALAKAVDVDPEAYAKRVLAAGPRAFVAAITLRQGAIPEAAHMPGMTTVPVDLPLAPSPTFAVGVLGGSALATPEQVKASNGDVETDDHLGTSGLQKRYDAQLRGTAGHVVQLARRNQGTEAVTGAPSPSNPSPSSTPEPIPSTSNSSSGETDEPTYGETLKTLFQSPEKAGVDLETSLDLEKQALAEQVLATQKGIASLVVVDVKTGAVLAAANSPAAGANPYATFGRFAPGSTFKVVTSLALLRKGFTPDSLVPCTATVTVDGRTFKNYSDFPASAVGRVPLHTALANSCNTAFISQWAKLGSGELAAAAASLGLGVDYDAGYSSFFGSVPASGEQTTRAADMIGQGTVEASPMAMAGVAASVAAGRTVVPWVVASKKPQPKQTLTPAEAKQLQSLMREVVTDGSGRVLQGLVTGAKTGTAEFGTAKPPKTHAWMIAWNSGTAIAAMVNEGESGSKTAAPLIKAYLEGAR